MDVLANLLHGFSVALTPTNLLYCWIGALLGTAYPEAKERAGAIAIWLDIPDREHRSAAALLALRPTLAAGDPPVLVASIQRADDEPEPPAAEDAPEAAG